MKYSNLSWADRLGYIATYQPSISQILTTFEISSNEYTSAQYLVKEGTLIPSPKKMLRYKNIFEDTSSRTKEINTYELGKGVGIRRGRRGNKIHTALLSVPVIPIPVKTYMECYSISLSVLRQHRRFTEKMSKEDRIKAGHIVVKQDVNSKELMIWSVKDSSGDTLCK